MKLRTYVAIGALAVVAGLGLASALPLSAQEPPPPPIKVEILSANSVFTDGMSMALDYALPGQPPASIDFDDPSGMVVAKITVQPGAAFPWHTHHGPVFVNVTHGKLIYVLASDCVERPYAAKTAFLDPGFGNVHAAFNGYHGETILIATFFNVPESGQLTITQGITPPANCPIVTQSHSH
jgi:hypothetical protein